MSLNDLPTVITEPGLYVLRNGTPALVREIVPLTSTFEAKGAIEAMFRGKPRFRGLEGWHVSGRYSVFKESQWDIVRRVA